MNRSGGTGAAPAMRSGPDILMIIAMLAVALVFVRALWFTPPDAMQGMAQKILYVHASAAWVAFIAFILVGIAGALYLFIGDERLDRFSLCSVEVGLLFISVVLVTGPIWGKPIWGAYWNWGDPRLTSTFVLWLVYLAYMVLRGAMDDKVMRARYSAIIGMMGALLVPFIHLSVYLMRSMHPKPLLATPEAFGDNPPMPGVMVVTLLLALGACLLLYIAFVRVRYDLELEREHLAALAAAEER